MDKLWIALQKKQKVENYKKEKTLKQAKHITRVDEIQRKSMTPDKTQQDRE